MLGVTAGANLLGLARYAGTSVQMVEARYGQYMPGAGAIAFRAKKPARMLASPAGFEPEAGRVSVPRHRRVHFH
jgi:hypothetical protein